MPNNEDIRKNIIDATRRLIMQKPSITIREIADACYVNVAAVNYYFGSKDRLLAIVLEEIIDEIQGVVTTRLAQVAPDAPIEATFEMMIDLIYSYAMSNIGVLAYLIMNVENRDSTSRQFIEAFFNDSDFKKIIFAKLREVTGLEDDDALTARYVLIFSCFVIPMLIQLIQDPVHGTKIADLENEAFKRQYIQQLVRMVR
ncbi:MAG: TetR/AcrR family transcriptional regulator [Bacillota bacterium]|nr:TetR/AcrR family transcriptional regulator [Bacillota bacterium]